MFKLGMVFNKQTFIAALKYYFATWAYLILPFVIYVAVSILILGKSEPKFGPIVTFIASLVFIQPAAVLFLLGTAIGRVFKRTVHPITALPMSIALWGIYNCLGDQSLTIYLMVPPVLGVAGQLTPLLTPKDLSNFRFRKRRNI